MSRTSEGMILYTHDDMKRIVRRAAARSHSRLDPWGDPFEAMQFMEVAEGIYILRAKRSNGELHHPLVNTSLTLTKPGIERPPLVKGLITEEAVALWAQGHPSLSDAVAETARILLAYGGKPLVIHEAPVEIPLEYTYFASS